MKSLKLVRFALGAGMMLATFVGCVDDNKDLYDPTITADNPLDITAPDGFDWSTTNTIRLSYCKAIYIWKIFRKCRKALLKYNSH